MKRAQIRRFMKVPAKRRPGFVRRPSRAVETMVVFTTKNRRRARRTSALTLFERQVSLSTSAAAEEKQVERFVIVDALARRVRTVAALAAVVESPKAYVHL